MPSLAEQMKQEPANAQYNARNRLEPNNHNNVMLAPRQRMGLGYQSTAIIIQ
jgi:hypothetical protein